LCLENQVICPFFGFLNDLPGEVLKKVTRAEKVIFEFQNILFPSDKVTKVFKKNRQSVYSKCGQVPFQNRHQIKQFDFAFWKMLLKFCYDPFVDVQETRANLYIQYSLHQFAADFEFTEL